MNRVHVLNRLIGLPTAFNLFRRRSGPDSSLYLFDYNYIDLLKTRDCLRALEDALASAGVDLGTKTLLLAAKGLSPANEALLDFARRFGDLHLFFEGWNGTGELKCLRAAELAHLYFHPVTTKLRRSGPARVPPRPRRDVFVSLGGDDDLDLVRAVIDACPELKFHVPDLSWDKSGAGKRFFPVQIDAPNVVVVDCSAARRKARDVIGSAYRAAFAACDIVLIVNVREKRDHMRGGVRVADALYARKHLVMTENPMCQLAMALDERTCLVARHDAAHLAGQLRRIASGRFQVDAAVYESVRHLTLDDNKLDWMIAAATDPAGFSSSVFACSPSRLASEVEGLFGIAELESVFQIAVGQRLAAQDANGFRVTRIASESRTAFLIELVPEGGGARLSIAIHAEPLEHFAMRTKRGNYLVCRTADPTEPARRLLSFIADRT